MIPSDTSRTTCSVYVADEHLTLTGKAIYWPARRALIVADLHFGKAASFRARGVPVPRGTTSQTLNALDELIAQHTVEKLYVLGDVLHARETLARATAERIQTWRNAHCELKMTLVVGNHDTHLRREWPVHDAEIVDGPISEGPFVLTHHPGEDVRGYVLCGHVHPAWCLRGRYDRLRLPCFWFRERYAVLPSFGAFTGGADIVPVVDDRLFVVADGSVYPV